MLLNYNPIILSTIIRISQRILNQVKSEIVISASRLETDDRSYLYYPEYYEVFTRRGPFIAKVSNYTPPNTIRLDLALKQTIQVLSREDKESLKYIFLILDRYDVKEEYGIIQGLLLDTKISAGCNIIFCDLGENKELKTLITMHPNAKIKYLQCEAKNLGREMINTYYPEEDRTVIDEEFKNKYGKTPYEARLELKEKYANYSNNGSL